MPGPRRSPGNGSCRDCRISGHTSPVSAARPRERKGRRPRVPRASGGFAGFSSRESLHRRRSPDTAKSSESRSGPWGAEIDAISVGADTWLSAGLRVAREAASRCWPGCGQVQGHPPDASAPAVRTVAGAVAPAPSHPARPGVSSGARTEQEAHITYMDKTVKAQNGMRYRPRLPSSSPLPEREGAGVGSPEADITVIRRPTHPKPLPFREGLSAAFVHMRTLDFIVTPALSRGPAALIKGVKKRDPGSGPG